ncbi:MAG: IS110 family transposase [Sporichthyaceae bacterium]|nr:IS110 family transposase [Sporichthyaceae bacterium]
MLRMAEQVDAVIGADTHRDTHALELAAPSGATLATATVTNDAAGCAAAVRFIAVHAPGPRLIAGVEGTRSYGIGLARALTSAGITVVEVERPARSARRRGKSDPIDAHLAALAVLRMHPDRLPTPRADGPREALRILLAARAELTGTKTRHTNQLRHLLRTGEDTDRDLARARPGAHTLAVIAQRPPEPGQSLEQPSAAVNAPGWPPPSWPPGPTWPPTPPT